MALSTWSGPIRSLNGYLFHRPATPTDLAVAQMAWNDQDGTLDLRLTENTVLQIGKQTFYRIKNQSGDPIERGDAISFAGAVGNSGVLSGERAIATPALLPAAFMGVAVEPIAQGAIGLVAHFGLVRPIDSRGGGEHWQEGDLLYLSPTTAGALTNVMPTAPNPKILVAAVVFRSPNGSIFVRPTIGENLSALHDVEITDPQDGDTLVYSAAAGVWRNQQP